MTDSQHYNSRSHELRDDINRLKTALTHPLPLVEHVPLLSHRIIELVLSYHAIELGYQQQLDANHFTGKSYNFYDWVCTHCPDAQKASALTTLLDARAALYRKNLIGNLAAYNESKTFSANAEPLLTLADMQAVLQHSEFAILYKMIGLAPQLAGALYEDFYAAKSHKGSAVAFFDAIGPGGQAEFLQDPKILEITCKHKDWTVARMLVGKGATVSKTAFLSMLGGPLSDDQRALMHEVLAAKKVPVTHDILYKSAGNLRDTVQDNALRAALEAASSPEEMRKAVITCAKAGTANISRHWQSFLDDASIQTIYRNAMEHALMEEHPTLNRIDAARRLIEKGIKPTNACVTLVHDQYYNPDLLALLQKNVAPAPSSLTHVPGVQPTADAGVEQAPLFSANELENYRKKNGEDSYQNLLSAIAKVTPEYVAACQALEDAYAAKAAVRAEALQAVSEQLQNSALAPAPRRLGQHVSNAWHSMTGGFRRKSADAPNAEAFGPAAQISIRLDDAMHRMQQVENTMAESAPTPIHPNALLYMATQLPHDEPLRAAAVGKLAELYEAYQETPAAVKTLPPGGEDALRLMGVIKEPAALPMPTIHTGSERTPLLLGYDKEHGGQRTADMLER